MFEVGMLVGYAGALVTIVPLLVWFDRRAERRDRIRLRVDQMPQPLPGAYERPPERVLAGPAPRPVVDGEVVTERN